MSDQTVDPDALKLFSFQLFTKLEGAVTVLVFDRERSRHGREAALLRPDAAGLPGLRVPESQPLVVPGTERASFTVHVALPSHFLKLSAS